MSSRALLLFPPCFFPHMPYLGTALLTGSLRAAGVDVSQVDLNVRWYRHVLTSTSLLAAWTRARSLGSTSEAASARTRSICDEALVEGLAGALPDANSTLRPGGRAAMPPTQAQLALDVALDVVSDGYAPTRVSFSGLRMAQSHSSSSQVLEATHDKGCNPFLEYFDWAVPKVMGDGNPDLVGVSIDVPDQIIPGFTLCRAIRRMSPETRIVLGGNVVTRLADLLESSNPLRGLYDFIIAGEGESGIVELTLGGKPPTERFTCGKGRTAVNPDEVPCPSFDDLDLGDYFGRQSILPMLASRRCYWDRCMFCGISQGYSPGYRVARAQKVVDDLIALQVRHGVSCFKFVDDALSPALLRGISAGIIERGLDVRWEAYAILESEFTDPTFCQLLHKAGCRWLYFGLETADTDLAGAMNKRTMGARADEILRSVAEAGIRTHVWVIIGFPGDTAARVQTTIEFIEKNRASINSVEVNQFALVRGAPLMRPENLDRYGLQPIIHQGQDMALTYDFAVREGMSPDDARALTIQARRHLAGLGYVNAVRSSLLPLCEIDSGDVQGKVATSLDR